MEPLSPEVIANFRATNTATVCGRLFRRGFHNVLLRNVRPLAQSAGTMVGPAYTLRFIPAREDLDGFARDVIEHPHFSNPKAILRLTQAPKALDPALAYPGRLVPQVPFQGVPHFGPMVGGQRPEGLGRRRGQDDLVPHSGQNIATFDIRSTRPLVRRWPSFCVGLPDLFVWPAGAGA